MLKQKINPLFILFMFTMLVGCSPSSAEFGVVSPTQAKSMIENDGAIMIDVREKSEYAIQEYC